MSKFSAEYSPPNGSNSSRELFVSSCAVTPGQDHHSAQRLPWRWMDVNDRLDRMENLRRERQRRQEGQRQRFLSDPSSTDERVINKQIFNHDSRGTNMEFLESQHELSDLSAFNIMPPFTKINSFQGAMHIIKSSIGTGVLAMPAAIRDAGLLVGSLGIVLISIVVTHAMNMLVESAQYLRQLHQKEFRVTFSKLSRSGPLDEIDVEEDSQQEQEVRLDYYETVRLTFQMASPSFQRWTWLAGVMNACLLMNQLGCLAVYQIFVSQVVKKMVDHYYPDSSTPELWVYLVSMCLLLLPLVFVKSLDKLSFLSGLANFLGVGGLLIAIFYCIQNLQDTDQLPLVKGLDTLPLSFGVLIFAFESINVLLPVENQMKTKADMRGVCSTLTVTMVCVCSLYVAVGFYGYLSFGSKVEGALIYNLPMNPWFYMLAKPMYALSIFISYTLQFYVMLSVLWEIILPHLQTRRSIFWTDSILRVSLVLLALSLAALIPHIELLISLVGAVAGAAIVLLFPSLIHSVNIWMMVKGDWRRCWFVLLKNALIFLFGIFGAVVGCGVSIKAIIDIS